LFSDQPIASPVSPKLMCLWPMNGSSAIGTNFKTRYRKGGIVFINSGMIHDAVGSGKRYGQFMWIAKKWRP
jgi:hypothetical protein